MRAVYKMYVAEGQVVCHLVEDTTPEGEGYVLLDHFASPDEMREFAPEVMAKTDAVNRIAELEMEITPRRLREALLSETGETWLAAQEAKIKTERKKL